MAKAEISWKRVNEDGIKLQVYAQRVGGEWFFFQRHKRFDQWEEVKDAPLEDWLELLDAIRRRVSRRKLPPKEEQRVASRILEIYPDARLDEVQGGAGDSASESDDDSDSV